MKRGYKRPALLKIETEISKIDRTQIKNRYISIENSTPKDKSKSKTMINRCMDPLTIITYYISN